MRFNLWWRRFLFRDFRWFYNTSISYCCYDSRNLFFWNCYYKMGYQVNLSSCWWYFCHFYFFSNYLKIFDFSFFHYFLSIDIFFPFVWSEFFFYVFLVVFIIFFYFFYFLFNFFNYFFILFRVFFVILNYFFYIIYYLFFGYFRLEDHTEGEAHFFSRPEPYNKADNYEDSGNFVEGETFTYGQMILIQDNLFMTIFSW